MGLGTGNHLEKYTKDLEEGMGSDTWTITCSSSRRGRLWTATLRRRAAKVVVRRVVCSWSWNWIPIFHLNTDPRRAWSLSICLGRHFVISPRALKQLGGVATLWVIQHIQKLRATREALLLLRSGRRRRHLRIAKHSGSSNFWIRLFEFWACWKRCNERTSKDALSREVGN